ncbi:MAG: serine/threonine-protein kinase [Planctomycetales bacterium]
MGESSQSSSAAGGLFCAGCNARFRWIDGEPVCPACGARAHAPPDVSLDDTLLYREEPETAARPAVASETQTGGDPLLGRTLHVYRCESFLGAGGMGRVYLARHLELERPCALKVLAPRGAEGDAGYVARFLEEGRAAAALVHPNIVTTHAIGRAGECHFLEMEYVPGRSLQHLLRTEGRCTPIRATALAVRIAEGLAAAHSAGIVHRDLKPDNVLLTHRGTPKIGDFGLAKRVHADDGRPIDELAGTPNFMAPELFAGTPANAASDVYALGVCYFALLTGRLPFVCGSLRALREAVAFEPVPAVRRDFPDVTLEMAECVSLLLGKNPAARPRDAREALSLLHAVWGEVQDLDSLLHEAFESVPAVRWTRAAHHRYQLDVSLPDGRRQRAFVEAADHPAAGRLLLIYSICCDASPDYYEAALRLNSEIPHGGLAIRDVEGRPRFIMADTYPRSTVDAEEIRRSVLEVASRADAVEQSLTGGDAH